jgi:hypothetical protein
MRIGFWLKRGFYVFVIVMAILFCVELIKGHTIEQAIYFSLVWAGISAVIFILTRIYYVNKGINCQVCNDLPTEKGSKKVEAFLYPEPDKSKD